jgi:predicted PurR-regulated permease PerM
LSLSFLSAVLNFVPIIGPIIAAIVAFIFLALDSWLKAVFFVVAFILIQQIEGAIISPILTKKFVGIPPVLVLLSVAVGGKLLGVLGAVLAIPMFGIIFEFLKDFLAKRKQEVPPSE